MDSLRKIGAAFEKYEGTASGPRKSLGTFPAIGELIKGMVVPHILMSVLRQQIPLLRDANDRNSTFTTCTFDCTSKDPSTMLGDLHPHGCARQQKHTSVDPVSGQDIVTALILEEDRFSLVTLYKVVNYLFFAQGPVSSHVSLSIRSIFPDFSTPAFSQLETNLIHLQRHALLTRLRMMSTTICTIPQIEQ
ncbi:hypothetical protein NP233_g7163 [Leucocoprinus birnbaumii]|uniref:Uncharacterized protein n=1 Tax=Leucocoprinus birnbaumii TaxID=56174 RepID=A0AAD5YV07_9AGAR|nr:hypothetical protein NP233_g7163 [Leucocoprinus birnbaumii]